MDVEQEGYEWLIKKQFCKSSNNARRNAAIRRKLGLKSAEKERTENGC